ncbi:MAG: SxtJ family membrane protein [Balneolia bacterium]|nr:SxtJ family membrane protein [Balneolia bacterium]
MTKKKSFLAMVMAEVEVNKKRIRDFGLVMLVVLSFIIPAFLSWRNDWEISTVSWMLFTIGVVLFLFSLVRPLLLTPVYKAWMGLAIILGLFMTKVIISLVFYLIMTPIGIGRRLLVKDPLGIQQNKQIESYWEVKENPVREPSTYEKQY